MASLKEEAQGYEPKQTKNIADLEVVRTDLELVDRVGKSSDGEEFKYKVVIVEGEEYRCPGSVLGNLKAILQQNSSLKTFKVTKTGTGLTTKYTVIPLA